MTDKVKIFKYQDQADAAREPIWVMVSLDHDAKGKPHAHMFQGCSSMFAPTGYDSFMKETEHNYGQVVLSVSDFPKLTKQIKQAVKDLKAEP